MRTLIALSTVLLLALFIFLGCDEAREKSPTAVEIVAAKKGGKPGPPEPSGLPLIFEFGDGGTYKITSDDRGSYENGECGVTATFNVNPSEPTDTEADARLVNEITKLSPKEAATCGERDPRQIMVAFTDAHPVDGSEPASHDGETVGAYFMNIRDVEDVAFGVPELRTAVMYFWGGECEGGLRFNPYKDPESNKVKVTNNGNGTWTVETQPFPNDVAVCIPNEGGKGKNVAPRSYYHLPFQVEVSLNIN